MEKNLGKLLKKFKKLNLPDGEYAIYGSGPLGARGIRDVNDLDVIVSNGLYLKLKEKYSKNFKKDRITIGKIEIYPCWKWEPKINQLENAIKQSELIEGIRFIRLNDMINYKKKMGRTKDFDDIKLIESYFKKN